MTTALQSLTEQRRLLMLEYESEKRAFSQLREKIGVDRLVERGDAWCHLRIGRTYYNSLNQRILEVFRTITDDETQEEDDHHFEYGRAVTLFTIGGDGTIRNHFQGVVSVADGDRMAISIPDSADVRPLAEEECDAGVMLAFDETTYRAMIEAIDRTIRADGRLGELRDFIYSRRVSSELTCAPMRFPYLNPSQEDAVNKVLRAKEVAVVHGPPGTGKTTTLVEAINETLRREPQVMVCAQSNTAVDWICEKLTDRGVKVLRIGNPSKVTDKMLSSTYERRFESHPDYPDLWSLRKTIRELHGSRKRSEQWHQKIERLKSRATELEIRINNDVFGEVNVIASTLVGSSSRQLNGMKFTTLFIDEAAQALEAACWIAIRRAGRVILAGDHCQLPPTVKCYEALKQGLSKSLMEKIVEYHPETVTLLTMQYRMHRSIMMFPNQWFYGGRMTAAPSVRDRSILDLDTPVEWLDTSQFNIGADGEEPAPDSFRESSVGENCGRINRDEALLTILALQNYIKRIGVKRFLDERIDVGVISPYRAQTRYLRTVLGRVPFFKPFRRMITINTVDGFQGQERDVIIISMVRSNERGDIGFLRDLRRMNVAITRARMKLIILGDVPTLSRTPFYRRLIRYVESLHDVRPAD